MNPGSRTALLLLTSLLWIAPAAAQQPDGGDPGEEPDEPQFNELGLRMTAEVVFDGRVQTNRWACALVEIENVGDPVDGMLVIRDTSASDGVDPTRYARPIDVPSKSRKRVFVYFEMEGWGSERMVELVGRGGRGATLAIAAFRTTAKEDDDVVVAVVGQDPMGFNVVRETWPGAVPGHPWVSQWQRRRVLTSLVPVEGLPDRAVGYNVVDVLIWSQPDPSSLSDDQLAALRHYVGMGGMLVIPVTDRWQQVADSPLAELLPVELRGATEVEHVSPLLWALDLRRKGDAGEGAVLIADARPRGIGETIRAQDGEQVLWAEREYGLGRVTFLAVDPQLAPIKGGVERDRFWRHVLYLPEPHGGQRDDLRREDVLRDELSSGATNTPDRFPGGRFALDPVHPISECIHDADELGTGAFTWSSGYYYGSSALDTWYNGVRQKLVDIPALQPLPLGWIVLFAMVYLLCIGPIDYFALKWIGRQEWTWFTFPLLIGGFFVLAVVGTTAAKGSKAVMTRLEVVDVFEPEGLWRGESYMGIFASQRTDLTMRSQTVDSMVEPMRVIPATTYWYGETMDEGFMERPAVQTGVGGGALAYHSETWTFAYLQSAWVDGSGERGHFRVEHLGGGKVSIHNETGVDLYSAMLLVGRHAYGATPPGDENWASLSTSTWDEATYSWTTAAPTGYGLHHVGSLRGQTSVNVDLDELDDQIPNAWPTPPEQAIVRPHDREDWDQFREIPEMWGERGHLDLTRMMLDGQLVLLGFANEPVEQFALEGLDPESEPRTLVRVVLGPDPRLKAPAPAPQAPGTLGLEGIGGSFGEDGPWSGVEGASVDLAGAGSSVLGSLSRDEIEDVIGQHLSQIQYCYEKRLLSDPALSGKVTTRIVIGADGSVSSATATGFDDDLDACLEGVLQRMQFPAPAGGGIVMVAYPFVFAPG